MREIIAALFVLTFVNVILAQKHSGIYELNPNQTVEIIDKSSSIKFDFEAASGDDNFKLNGTAKLVRKNVYEYRTIIRGKVDNSICRIRFTFSGVYLNVKEDPECGNYRFPIVMLDGRYEKL